MASVVPASILSLDVVEVEVADAAIVQMCSRVVGRFAPERGALMAVNRGSHDAAGSTRRRDDAVRRRPSGRMVLASCVGGWCPNDRPTDNEADGRATSRVGAVAVTTPLGAALQDW